MVERVETVDLDALKRQRARFDAGWLIRDLNAWLFPTERLGNCGTALGAETRQGRTTDGESKSRP